MGPTENWWNQHPNFSLPLDLLPYFLLAKLSWEAEGWEPANEVPTGPLLGHRAGRGKVAAGSEGTGAGGLAASEPRTHMTPVPC